MQAFLAPARARLRDAPLAGRYGPAVALALLALCPFIVLTTAVTLLGEQVTRDLGTTAFGVQLTAGLSNAGYAFGAVAAADLIQRMPGRRLFILCEGGFVVGSALAALSSGIVLYAVGRVLQGVVTGMLLVAALPPLVTKHGADRLPSTAMYVNLGLFGMVTVGPVVGGLVAAAGVWRWLFVAVGVLGAVGLALGVLAFEPNDPPNRGMDFDWLAIPLAAGATVAPFFGVAWLSRSGFGSPGFIAPVAAGLLILAALIVTQYRQRAPLMPVRLISHTLPVVGTLGAMVVGAAFTTLLELAETYLTEVASYGPLTVGVLLVSQVAGVGLAAWLFKRVLPTRWMPHLAFSGLVCVAVAGGILLLLSPGNAAALVPVAAVLLGFGAGAGVAPALFLAGLSVASSKLGPTFALVELLRSEAAFLVGPVLLTAAMAAGSLSAGLHTAIWIVVALLVVSGAGLLGLYRLGGAKPHEPDLEAWLGGEEGAYESPPVAARVRAR